jgi:hypothetical protein
VHFGLPGEAGTDGVNVGIDQAWNDSAAAKIDDASGRRGKRADISRAADGGDFPVAYGERLGRSGVGGDDLAVEQDGVGDLGADLRCTKHRHSGNDCEGRVPDAAQRGAKRNGAPLIRDRFKGGVC